MEKENVDVYIVVEISYVNLLGVKQEEIPIMKDIVCLVLLIIQKTRINHLCEITKPKKKM
jgi:hypothetical protein